MYETTGFYGITRKKRKLLCFIRVSLILLSKINKNKNTEIKNIGSRVSFRDVGLNLIDELLIENKFQ